MKIKNEPIFSTANCQISESSKIGQFNISFFGEEITVRWCSLLGFRNQVKQIPIMEILTASSYDVPFEIYYFRSIDKICVLDTHQIIELKRLIEGTFSMLLIQKEVHLALTYQ